MDSLAAPTVWFQDPEVRSWLSLTAAPVLGSAVKGPTRAAVWEFSYSCSAWDLLAFASAWICFHILLARMCEGEEGEEVALPCQRGCR